MLDQTLITTVPHRPKQPRAEGGIHARMGARDGLTVLRDLRQSGAMKAVFPRQTSASADVMLINTSGGITSGDNLQVDVVVETGADLTITTQAAERAYRAVDGWGRVATRLSIAADARLAWLPQETLLYDGAALQRCLTVDVAPGGQLLLCEPLVFGRAAMNETLNAIELDDRITIQTNGVPRYLDAARLSDPGALHGPATAAGAGAAAQIVMIDPAAEAMLPQIRAILPATAGASLLAADLLAVRILAPDSFVLRQSLVPVLEILARRALPVSWRL